MNFALRVSNAQIRVAAEFLPTRLATRLGATTALAAVILPATHIGRSPMLRVLHSGIDEQLRALRHRILARVDCQVVSLPPRKAIRSIATETPDVLVACSQMGERVSDALCRVFRNANPHGRLVAIVSMAWISAYEADLEVDAHSPEALVNSVLTYPAVKARFKYTRRLVFVESDKFSGWTCERCCWNQRLLDTEERVRAAFETHSCEVFARGSWLGSSSL